MTRAETGAAEHVRVRRADRGDDVRWMRTAHVDGYRGRFADAAAFHAVVDRILDDVAETRVDRLAAGWIAELCGERVGSVLLVSEDASTARLRLLLVAGHARGLGIAGRLVEACVAHARDAGLAAVVLWTTSDLGRRCGSTSAPASG